MQGQISQQVGILFKKNLLVMWKTNETLKSLIFPLITNFLLYLGTIRTGNDRIFYQSLSLYFIPISFMSVTRQVVFTMVEEKQTKQKEIQKIMGVKQVSYVVGWLLTNLYKVGIVVLIFLGFSIPFHFFGEDNSNLSNTNLIITFTMFGLAEMAQSYFISVFFSVPKTAGDISVLLNVVGNFMGQLFLINYVQDNPWVVYLMGLFPPVCIFRLMTTPLTSSRIQFTTNQAIGMLIFDTALYFILYVYFDQVIPNEYGTHKSPLFFLKCKGRQNIQANDGLALPFRSEEEQIQQQICDDTSSAIYHQSVTYDADLIRSMEITNLSKRFGNLQAVDGLSLQVYESQILCLLGHNGAGKTTMLSLVTGLIEKDSGDVKYYGKSIDTDLDDIRQYTGICVQRDVLYGELTVEEHLNYYAQMKGFQGQEMINQVQHIISRCVLQGERNKQAKQLSGGNKRKLSLAIALVGNSKVIFLDEPTSGMDPVTRRAIWDILLEVKKEKRTLILTTHHLDEAEELSERIAIMAQGKLLTVGSADFIKKNFGIGYHLNIYKKDESKEISPSVWSIKREQIKAIVLKQIHDAQYNPQTSEDTITFLLPFQDKHNLIPLFKILEDDGSIYIDLALTSLEEAFINIGMDQEQFMSKMKRQQTGIFNIQQEPSQQEEFTDFSSIPVPQCLYNSPVYSFINQFEACFLRKYHTTKVGKKFIIQILVPLFFEVLAVMIVYINKDEFPNQTSLLIFGSIAMTLELSFGMCISAASIAGQLVQEREDKLKYALNVMGCRIIPYWLATMLFDCLVSFSLIIILIIMLHSLGLHLLATPVLCTVYFMTQFAFVGASYAISWLYVNANKAYKTVFLLMFAMFVLVPLIIFFIWGGGDTKFIIWVCTIISPIFTMFQAIAVNSDTKSFTITNHPTYIGVLLFQGLAGLALCLFIDTRSLRAASTINVRVQQVNEADVIQEAERVSSEQCQDSVKTSNLSKMYSNGYFAVKGTSFGINKGEVFGLLGPNGAGKSTTFNMLTSRLKPSNGYFRLLNQVAERGNAELYQNVGVCPQFDCLWEAMTPVEHLKLFAMIKGLRGSQNKEAVEYFMRIMQLNAYRETMAVNLSGGNKRKLCVAIALIGSPCLQFFDEPSSGVDPIARRFLWNTIQQGLRINSSAVLLTTHSMDEAESLCHKIGIQVNGQFVCMGSPQQLKKKYGSGYRIQLDVINQGIPIKEMVQERFPQSTVIESIKPSILLFQFPSQDFSFFDTFDYFLNIMQTRHEAISDFSIVQGNLEQVFLHFASFQVIRPENAFQPISGGIFQTCYGNDEDD